MISGIFLVGERFGLLFNKIWIDDYSHDQVQDYVLNVAKEWVSSFPVHKIENAWFIHYIEGSIRYVAVCTQEGANVNFILEFLSNLPGILSQALPTLELSETTFYYFKQNIAKVVAVLDELVVAGMPISLTASEIRWRFCRNSQLNSAKIPPPFSGMAEGGYIDVLETLTVLLNGRGEVIESLVEGRIEVHKNVKRDLTFDLVMTDPVGQIIEAQKCPESQVSTCKLGSDIIPLPTDDPCHLAFTMSEQNATVCEYTSNKNVRLPLKITWKVEADPDVRMCVMIESTVGPVLDSLTITVPLADRATKTKHEATRGKTKVVEEENAVKWKFKQFHGKATLNITSKVLSADQEVTSRRINARFSVLHTDRKYPAARVTIRNVSTREKVPLFWRNVIQTENYEVAI